MRAWPLIVVKRVTEDLALEESSHFDSLFKQKREVFQEQVGRSVIVLVLHDVINDCRARTNLVVSESLVDCVSVVKLAVLNLTFLDFVLVKDGEFFAEEL